MRTLGLEVNISGLGHREVLPYVDFRIYTFGVYYCKVHSNLEIIIDTLGVGYNKVPLKEDFRIDTLGVDYHKVPPNMGFRIDTFKIPPLCLCSDSLSISLGACTLD